LTYVNASSVVIALPPQTDARLVFIGRILADWLLSPAGQAAIGAYEVDGE
jgi:hypothetical protein